MIRATGYRGTALPGVPFDERRGVIPNVGGRVRAGEYVVGWAKRGPSGVIGTNKKDAQETVEAVLADLEAGALAPPSIADADEVAALLTERQPDVLDYAHWQIIDRYEQGLGEPHGRPRVKLTRVGELLAAAGCTG